MSEAVKKKKVLIVEDSLDACFFERKLLEMSGYEVMTANNAKDGVALAIEQEPDIVLMDIRLPSKKRGIGAARFLRKNEKTRDVPIIFVTGYIGGSETKEIQNITNCSYLEKPFEIDILLAEIEKYLT